MRTETVAPITSARCQPKLIDLKEKKNNYETKLQYSYITFVIYCSEKS
jgi:hypothetical protein